MAISVDQIDEWRQLPAEKETLEFKEAKSQFDTTTLLQYCVAIANEGGGHLLLGIQNAIPRMVVGTKAVNDPHGMSEKIFNKLGFRVDVQEVQHPDGRIVVFVIPPRPNGRPVHLDGAYFMRLGSSLRPMTPEQIERIILEGRPEWSDQFAATGVGSAAVLELLDMHSFFRLLESPFPASQREIIDRLIHERLIVEDQRTSGFAIRRVGAILLARDITAFPDLARKTPRVIEYEGNSKLDSPRIDQVGNQGYAVGFQTLVHLINTHLPRKEVIEDALRKEVRMVPEIAIRELVANALIHQDLCVGGTSVTIEIFNNRVEIASPGIPLIAAERFIDSERSRNERMAHLMRRMRICEERGSGVDKVVNAAEVYDLPAPDFRVGEQRTVATIYGPQDFDHMDREARIRACSQHCILKYVRSERMTNLTLRERFRLPESRSTTVSQVILAALETKTIKLDQKFGSSRRFRRYVPYWA